MPALVARVMAAGLFVVWTSVAALSIGAGISSPALAQQPKGATASAPGNAPMPPTPAVAVGSRYSLELTFLEPSGGTLATRNLEVTLGKTDTVSVSQGGRTVSAEITVSAGAKLGCNHIDVTLRDKRIDSTGHFNKTVWQSGSDPCGGVIMTLGPKEETRLRLSIKPKP